MQFNETILKNQEGGMMTFFNWEDRYDLRVGDMNDEHKVLISKMNKLHDLNEAKATKQNIQIAFEDFAAYTVKHFKDEEVYLESISYPGLD